jgi:pimeloyl-ACP methyl ester carboxylesterase
MPWIELEDSDIYYVERGTGPPLVFLHGMTSCCEAWLQQFDAFSSSYRCIAYDSVNHGHSSNSPRDAPEPDRADELEHVLAALGIERPIIAGNSMGAFTLLRWACRHPGDAAALLPSGMGVREEEPADVERRRRLGAPIDADTVFLPFGDSLTPALKERDPRLYDRYFRIRSTATRIEALRHPRQPTVRNPTRREMLEAVTHITSPMLIVVGALDALVPAAERLHELVPHSEYVAIPDSPHNVYWETAPEYNAAVRSFLDCQPSA